MGFLLKDPKCFMTFFEGSNYLSSQKLLKTGITGINQLLNHDYILDAVGSWQIILPMPNLERAY